MALGVHLLDIHQQQVRDGHQGQKPGIEGLGPGKGVARGIDAGVDALCLGLGKELQQKVYLQQRLPTADGDASLFAPVAPAAQGFLQELVGGIAVGGWVF